MTDTNGPACAYCGKRYDFANRPVKIENCCAACLPPQDGRRWALLGRTRRGSAVFVADVACKAQPDQEQP